MHWLYRFTFKEQPLRSAIDPYTQLDPLFESGLLNDESKFNALISEEKEFSPMGLKIADYSRNSKNYEVKNIIF